MADRESPYWQGMTRQERILDAMAEANPDVDGSLMRELAKRGVAGQVEDARRSLCERPARRSRFVPGWRP